MKQRTDRNALFVALMCWAAFAPSLLAQDIHFSQFFNAPPACGPGRIGTFDGEYRLNGIFRQQWRSVTIPYRTFALGGDARDFGGVKGLGAGIWTYSDKAGDSRLQQFHLSIGASWTERFGPSSEHALSGGAQFGFTSISIDRSAMTFDAQYNGFAYDPSLANNEQFQREALTHADLHAGLLYRYRPGQREMIELGLSFFNLTAPRIGLLGSPPATLDQRFALQVITRFPVAEKVDLLPMLQYMTQGRFNELDIGGNVRYILLDRYGLERAVSFGAHYRADDAGYIYAGLEHDDWTFGVSYDVNTSDLVPASRNRGGVELSIIRIFRDHGAVPVRFKACPDQY
ncbi:MAG: PorP/SprF family type IX secretion system membrane protein [Flavobacteriales bacterium]|nr:PorP/SprF family type IX secretion system membrane protein [Flavobacteriales bacterium]